MSQHELRIHRLVRRFLRDRDLSEEDLSSLDLVYLNDEPFSDGEERVIPLLSRGEAYLRFEVKESGPIVQITELPAREAVKVVLLKCQRCGLTYNYNFPGDKSSVEIEEAIQRWDDDHIEYGSFQLPHCRKTGRRCRQRSDLLCHSEEGS